ncbi:hypothetical protein BLS_003075 [Venturia inaequalis]|uniref:Uncharacterized protein n=1 Tax=Venturia inaequalis TaxID=5025 RepID=A0A8H3URY0_VENIN|nr:hypothetical protein BLS_003075 [Venturia inaequalis]
MFKNMIPRLSAKLGRVVRKVVKAREMKKEMKKERKSTGELKGKLAQWFRKSPLTGGEEVRGETEEQLAPGVLVGGEEEMREQEALVVVSGGEEERSESEEQLAAPGVMVEDEEDDVFFDAEAGVPEGPGMGPGTPRWLECVSECAVSDGEETRDVVRLRRGKMGVVRCSEKDVWDERVAEQGLCEGLQEKGVGWWDEVLNGRVSGGMAAMLAFLWWDQMCSEAKRSRFIGWWLDGAGWSSRKSWSDQVRREWEMWREEEWLEGLREVDCGEHA